MDINVMMQYVTYGLALIGVLAFLVSIIVQVIKEMPGINCGTGHIADSLPGGTGHLMYIL